MARAKSKVIKDQQRKSEYEKKKVTNDMIRYTVFDWSFRDTLNGEIVFEAGRVPEIKRHLKVLCGYVPTWAINREFGEVLNNKVIFQT